MLDTTEEDVPRPVVRGAEIPWLSMVIQPWEAHVNLGPTEYTYFLEQLDSQLKVSKYELCAPGL